MLAIQLVLFEMSLTILKEHLQQRASGMIKSDQGEAQQIYQLLTMKHLLWEIECNQNVFINFIDFEKAFDSIHVMWKMFQNARIQEHIHQICIGNR